MVFESLQSELQFESYGQNSEISKKHVWMRAHPRMRHASKINFHQIYQNLVNLAPGLPEKSFGCAPHPRMRPASKFSEEVFSQFSETAVTA